MYTIVYLNVTEEEKERLQAIDGYDFHFYNKRETIKQEDLDQVEIVLGQLPQDIANTCPKLKYICLDCAGVDQYTELKEEITLTNAKGVYNEIIGELMTCYTLLMQKRVIEYYEEQKKHHFHKIGTVDSSIGSKVLVVGMGGIGSAYARRMHAMGAIVDGVTRTKKEAEDYINAMYTMEDLSSIIQNYDVVASILPQTKETIGVYNEELFRKMKKDAYFMNVGRGSNVVTNDLIKVLQDGYFKGVYLDVVDPEPLPKNSTLYRFDRVLITPHVAGRFAHPSLMENILTMYETSLNNLKNNKEPINIVDRSIGY